jgi:glycosyltransferase involved in cell wall biosynthesis
LAFSKEIRILQLIDSLEAGGAERMAVSYANALNRNIGFGALVATRTEGALKNQLDKNVAYCYLNRKSTFDFKALFLLRRFVVQNKITHIHAHSSSVFFGVLLKMVQPKLQLIWHDHYGNSELLDQRPVLALKMASLFVSKIVAVNYKLKNWSQEKLWCEKVTYLPNFTGVSSDGIVDATHLKGEEGKRIICLANLRPQKNHSLLLQIAKEIYSTHPDWTFHLVGKDFEDSYSNHLKEEIIALGLADIVFIYGSRHDIPFILDQSTIGVLTSESEGLPIAVLEYGLSKLPVISTSVGEIPTVLTDNEGILISSNDSCNFVLSLRKMIDDKKMRFTFAENLHKKIIQNYSEEAVMKLYLKWINDN